MKPAIRNRQPGEQRADEPGACRIEYGDVVWTTAEIEDVYESGTHTPHHGIRVVVRLDGAEGPVGICPLDARAVVYEFLDGSPDWPRSPLPAAMRRAGYNPELVYLADSLRSRASEIRARGGLAVPPADAWQTGPVYHDDAD